MRSQLRVNLNAGDEAIRQLDDFVRAFASRNGLSADDTARTLILIEELATNLVKYGYPGQPALAGFAEVTLDVTDGQLTIEFLDDGVAFDPLNKPASDLNQLFKNLEAGGLGLHLIRALANEAQYTRADGRNLVRLGWRVSRPAS